MTERKIMKFVRVGKYGAEVEVTLIESDSPWSPFYSLEDALKLERIEEALKAGDIAAVAKEARVFEITPIAAE